MITQMGKTWAFSCRPGCGKTEGGFPSKGDAEIAKRLHQIGCKKS